MSSIPRYLSRLLRRQPPATPLSKAGTIPIRTAQTQATPSALKSTQPPPPFQHQHAHQNPSPQTLQSKIHDTDVISNHPVLHSLRQDPGLKESRPHLSMPSALRPSHFIAGSLSGEGKLATAPYLFLSRRARAEADQGQGVEPRQSRAVTVFHTGTHMCGHPGYVHGGFLSVMFDEIFAHCVSQSFRSGTGMTANLNVDFRKPALPGRVYVLRAETVKVEGRKAWAEGTMTMMPATSGAEEEPVVVAEARALFIEPKFVEVC
ncbi:HotDog domain-containing protein [Aspergillus varians]